MSGSGVSKYGCVLSNSGTSGSTRVGWREPRNFRHLKGKEDGGGASSQSLELQSRTAGLLLSLPDGVAVGGVLVEVLQQLQQSQLDALFGGDVGVTNQLVESFSDVARRVLEVNDSVGHDGCGAAPA